MNIVFISHYPELYGANRSLLDLFSALKKEPHVKPHLICAKEGALPELARSMDIPCGVHPFNTWMSERVYMGRPHHRFMQHLDHRKRARIRQSANQMLLPIMQEQVKQWQCDLIYTNSSVIGIGYQLSRSMGLPHIWHIREFAQLHYQLYFDIGKKEFKRGLRAASNIIAISQAIERHIHSICGRNDISVVYNGVLRKAQFAEVQKRCAWPKSTIFTFAMVGLLHPSKGQLEAIDAIKELGPDANVRLLIAGSGKTSLLEQRILEYGLVGKVELLGYCNDPYNVYAQCHAVLMCSKFEGMGRVTAEAMAAGRPVIGHASGGTPELIENGVNGSLYGEGHASLVACMRKFIADMDKTKALGERAAELARSRFSIEEYGDKVMQVLRKFAPRPK